MTKCSDHFTFVSNWDNDAITPSTFRLYSRRVPAKDARQTVFDRVRRQIEERNRREKKAEEDVEKLRYSHEDWNSFRSNFFSIGTETNELLFFKGVIFECTYNDSGKFSQSQMALL